MQSKLCLIICFAIFVLIPGNGGRKPKDNATSIRASKKEKCFEMTSVDLKLRLTCRRNTVIYAININSYNTSRCSDRRDACSGLQPSVLTESNLCYSERRCFITFNNRTPIVKTSNAGCIGKKPSVLTVQHKCVVNDIFHAMHLSGKHNDTKQIVGDLGMLVSHDNYPWYYEETMIKSWVTLKPDDNSKKKLYMTVSVFDLDPLDLLKVSAPGQQVEIEKPHRAKESQLMPTSGNGTLVSFMTDKSTTAGKGFIICYMFTGVEDTGLLKKDICSKLPRRKRKSKTDKPKRPRKRPRKGKSSKKNRGRKA